jgi:hypothetical protein
MTASWPAEASLEISERSANESRPTRSPPCWNQEKNRWHTFRHTYATTLIANGENVKVVQKLMRHANSRCTLDVYSQARVMTKREAQQRIVEMVLPEDGLTEIKLQRKGSDERLSGD